ncbi:MAG: hypothetical protein IAE91_09665 [Ignavibacteriaceae bacterium]|nr:hypothetical protein [Ignavibacteriaceae bacterium]
MIKKLHFSVLLILIVGLLGASVLSAQGPQRSYIIMANDNGSSLASSISAAGGVMTQFVPELRAAFATSSNPNFASQIRGVRSVIPDLIYQFDMPDADQFVSMNTVGDPPFSGSQDFFFDLQWGHNAVRAQQAWANGVRGEGVRVAVLDGGFDLAHPDLAPNINLALSANSHPGINDFNFF